ncbi:MAG: chromate efflux transporter [Candidatus Hydrogenedentes bacterium]|nr:chromate efflux transporter [Candidatus Hydrogenedentota bacterium]
MHERAATSTKPTFQEATRTWAYIGLNSFGGPAGQIAVMHRVLVDEKKWISEERFLHALNYCMLLPGPEAQQLATYVGWLLHGARGGIVAGTLFVIPGIVAILALSILYAGFQQVTIVQSLFWGLKAAVLAVVVEAVLRIGKRALKSRFHYVTAGFAFIGIFFFEAPFPMIVAAAAIVGLVHNRFNGPTKTANNGEPSVSVEHQTPRVPALRRSLLVLAIWVPLWFGPVAFAALVLGRESVYFPLGTFFSKAAMVTFGGAYSVLAYVAQQAVNTYGWLKPGEMLDGLAMAETTPGPLIMVVQFVGFMAAFRDSGGLPPIVAGTLASLLTTWVTFAPCFLWIFLGAPYIEALRGNKQINAALSTITAAVVGVVLNLSIWFTIHTIFKTVDEAHFLGARLLVPDWRTADLWVIALASAAMIATFRFHVGVMKVLAACAIGGIAIRLSLGAL